MQYLCDKCGCVEQREYFVNKDGNEDYKWSCCCKEEKYTGLEFCGKCLTIKDG